MSLPPDEVGEAEGGAAQHAIVTALLLRRDAGRVRARARVRVRARVRARV